MGSVIESVPMIKAGQGNSRRVSSLDLNVERSPGSTLYSSRN